MIREMQDRLANAKNVFREVKQVVIFGHGVLGGWRGKGIGRERVSHEASQVHT